jgi:spectinomycin phosphotransferase
MPVEERPVGLDDAELAAALAQHWGIIAELAYAPVGFGGFHWVATGASGERWFVTVNDLHETRWTSPGAAFDDLGATMKVAAALAADAGLDFVAAPVRAVSGDAVARVHPRYALMVFPFVSGTPGYWEDVLSAGQRLAITGLLARLHSATGHVPAAPVRYPVLAGRALLEAAIAEAGQPWHGGPFAEPARVLIAEHVPALRGVLSAFDELAAEEARTCRAPVITHGEPHSGNLIWDGGRCLLIDWDTAGLAPQERDLWMLADGGGDELARYTEITGRPVSERALRLYSLR